MRVVCTMRLLLPCGVNKSLTPRMQQAQRALVHTTKKMTARDDSIRVHLTSLIIIAFILSGFWVFSLLLTSIDSSLCKWYSSNAVLLDRGPHHQRLISAYQASQSDGKLPASFVSDLFVDGIYSGHGSKLLLTSTDPLIRDNNACIHISVSIDYVTDIAKKSDDSSISSHVVIAPPSGSSALSFNVNLSSKLSVSAAAVLHAIAETGKLLFGFICSFLMQFYRPLHKWICY